MKIRASILFAMAALLLLALPLHAQVQNWTLVWSDEFNGSAGPFTQTSSNNQWWTFETGQGVFGTGEIEDMIADGTTSYLDGNGHLVIKTYQSGSTYYSARFKTKLNGSFGKDFSYGRVEASIQIPTSQGIWPAFWMLGDNGVSWPGCGEIDIMENNGSKPTEIKGTIHGIGYANTGLGAHFDSSTPFYQGYHTYGAIWSPYLIQFYVDSVTNIYASYTPGEIMGVGSNGGTSTLGQWDFFAHPFYIIFDVAVGGGFPGPPGAGTVMPQFMNIDYVRVYQAAAPNAPTSLTATAVSNSQLQLSWNASTTNDPGLTYNIFRSTTAGTEHSSVSDTNFSTMIATGVTATSFTDVMLTPGTAYHYQVTATGQESGESGVSNEANVTTPLTGTNAQAIAISSGSLVGTQNFVQDTGYSAGASNAYPDVIDTSGVANPAPQGVYRTERWGPTTYTIPNLTPNGNATVRLHFAETAFTAAGQRAFNVAINGTQVLTNYDIFADAGAEFKATEKVFSTAADSNGKITIALTAGTNGAPHTNPSIRGLEVIPAGGACSPPTTPTNFTATAVSSSEIDLSWTASTGQPCGGTVTYKVSRNGTQIASGLSGTSLNDTGLTASTTYSYTVTAVNSAGSSANASASATTQAGTTNPVKINAGGPAVSPFVADADFSGGGTISHANTIDLSGVTNPAPMAVYQTGRDGNFTYTIPGFTASSSHTVRLHFAETYWSSAGSRIFNVSINGTTVLTNFDIFAAAGAKNKAVIEQFSEPANSNGQYVITFTRVKDNSLVSGIEIQ